MNPLSRLLAAIVGALLLAGAFFFGFIILLAILAVGLIAGLVIWLRVWWIKRKIASGEGPVPTGFGEPPLRGRDPANTAEDVIDAEYEVVSRTEEKK
ncbi:MAG: hypothetical protein V2I48_12220 [Xanthomonadales bacterium]|jgi:hypothetical protein|nr:hypothetical protein [Xanthomonadales bacterium]